MAILKKPAIEAFIRAPSPETKAVLIYGPDVGRVHEVAAGIVRSAAGSLDDPFTVVNVSDNSLAADPALLADEARSLSLVGGRRVIWVSPAGRGFQGAIESYLTDPGGDGLIVAEAGALQKSSRMRTLLEQSKQCAVIACYEDTTEDLRDLVKRAAAEARLAVSDDVLEHIVDRIGADRALSRREVEKLMLYCYGRESVELDHLDAVCGDVSAASLDALLDATFGGDIAECCRRLAQLEEGGMSASGVLTSIGGHVARLQEFRNEIDRGKPRDSVLRGARPPIPFPRQPSIGRQLALWSGSALDGALGTVLEATALTRQFGSLEHAITERTLMSLARRAQALRRRAA